jgi:hypothetical protein
MVWAHGGFARFHWMGAGDAVDQDALCLGIAVYEELAQDGSVEDELNTGDRRDDFRDPRAVPLLQKAHRGRYSMSSQRSSKLVNNAGLRTMTSSMRLTRTVPATVRFRVTTSTHRSARAGTVSVGMRANAAESHNRPRPRTGGGATDPDVPAGAKWQARYQS